ncbi:MAG: type III pantothenate kinase [Candidatus Marinimicrobia bacterium]|nr:type III pantothenate kinase [Candidatus Neomarinimicrobiota bacterium]
MLLAIEIGNSHVVVSFFNGADLLYTGRLPADASVTPFRWWELFKTLIAESGLDESGIQRVAISSVVPVVGAAIHAMAAEHLPGEPLQINANLPLDLGLDVTHPDSVGADRICNVVACRELYGTPGVVVDLGTATTFDVIDEQGHFIGGSIMPGVEASARQLFSAAALLSKVELKVPASAIGRDTESNLQAGIIFGAVDQVDGMLRRIANETGWEHPQRVVTGGQSHLIAPLLSTAVIHDPDLTVQGLRIIAEKVG